MTLELNVNYSDQNVVKSKNSIFLAGPSPRGEKNLSWRPEACKYLQELGFDGVVYYPEYETEVQFDYNKQVLWEWEALEEAGIIIFWIPREREKMPALTTNVEFGYYVRDKKSLYGRPDYAYSIEYLDRLYKRHHNEEIFKDLKSLCAFAVKRLQD